MGKVHRPSVAARPQIQAGACGKACGYFGGGEEMIVKTTLKKSHAIVEQLIEFALNSFTKNLTVNGTDASSYIEVPDFKCPGCKKHTWDELKPDWESKEVKLGERIYWWLFYTCSCGAKYRFIDSRVGENDDNC